MDGLKQNHIFEVAGHVEATVPPRDGYDKIEGR
jgi:hypothetical protein